MNDESTEYRLLIDRIADAAVDVRIHQKTYFKTRKPSDLIASKQAEKKLDLFIAQRAQTVAGKEQYKAKEEKTQPTDLTRSL